MTGRIWMKTKSKVALSALTGVALGVASTELVPAETKPVAYVIAGNLVNNESGYANEFAPAIAKSIWAAGGKLLVIGGKTIPIHGKAIPRIVVSQFESLEKAEAWANASGTKAAFALGEKYAILNDFIVEGAAE